MNWSIHIGLRDPPLYRVECTQPAEGRTLVLEESPWFDTKQEAEDWMQKRMTKKTLTASELIELLKTLPLEMEVWITCEGGCVREGITGFRSIVDGHIDLDTTGN